MKPGRYEVTIEVNFEQSVTKDEADQGIMTMFSHMIDDDVIPELEFELLEEFDLEYTREDEIKELEF